MSKKVEFGLSALLEVKKGVDLLADAVQVTYGPKGNTVIIYENSFPKVTKDGVTVAQAISSSNPLYDIGIQLVKEAATKTSNSAGDGTTTSTILARFLIDEIYSKLSEGVDPQLLKKELERSIPLIRDFILKESTKVDSKQIIKDIATISSNGDEFIGSLIADTIEQIGHDGVITLEESNNIETYVTVVEGMKIPRGYISSYFINTLTDRSCVLENPYIFLYDGVLNNVSKLFILLEEVAKQERPIAIIANEFSPDVIDALTRNVNRGLLKAVAIRTPGIGEYKRDIQGDLSIITGATLFSNIPTTTDGLGGADKIASTVEETAIIGGHLKDKEALLSRIDILKRSLEEDIPTYLLEDIKSRIAKLSGGVAVIHVGATTEIELSEKKDRIEDAVCATKAAIEEGVVTGAGYIQEKLSGMLFVYEAPLLAKALQDCRNLLKKTTSITLEDAISKGILDPAKVTRVSIENALSVALMYLSTQCIIIEE